ncbi:sodium/glutamate symporter [Succinimonas sp.]|uniref:sodium/glutamate symporter n=1 Tax=Succinimonas sp. TaxID=1936151 RepID=UPI003866689A
MQENEIFTYHLDMTAMLGIATVLLLAGHGIKMLLPVLKRFYIPSPVIGGVVFAIVTLLLYEFRICSFTYDGQLKDLFMMTFFTSIGFMASAKMLVHGGIGVFLFLICSTLLILCQNAAGVSIAALCGENPLLGVAAGSISLSGGHGTSAAFGPELEKYGLSGGLSVSVACATFGLVAGSVIGGPIGKLLMARHRVSCKEESSDTPFKDNRPEEKPSLLTDQTLLRGALVMTISIALGSLFIRWLNSMEIIIPAYLGPMVIASVIRNIADFTKRSIPVASIYTIGAISLEFFLAMALMSMRLWELKDLALPLISILAVQCVIMALFAYFITFRIMGKNYDAAVIACGQCGFAMGATPNAMANMRTFTLANGASPKAFFVVPMVGALFIDFVNAFVVTGFIKALS